MFTPSGGPVGLGLQGVGQAFLLGLGCRRNFSLRSICTTWPLCTVIATEPNVRPLNALWISRRMLASSWPSRLRMVAVIFSSLRGSLQTTQTVVASEAWDE